MNEKWKFQFSDGDTEVLKIVLQHMITQNERVTEGDRSRTSSPADVTAHRVCLSDCKRIIDYITSTTG
jgi:hypothetical protein